MLLWHIARLISTVVILWVTWHNAHWSVALPITLLAINAECQAILWRGCLK